MCDGFSNYMERYERYMLEALKEAELAAQEDEVPIGCVVVKDDKIISRAHNQRDKSHNPLGHAEVDETGAYYTERSKPERKTPIQYTNAYIWNLERW